MREEQRRRVLEELSLIHADTEAILKQLYEVYPDVTYVIDKYELLAKLLFIVSVMELLVLIGLMVLLSHALLTVSA